MREFFAVRNEERKGNLEKKLAIITRAEALAESTDWIKTADELKKLQYDIILPGHGPAFKDTVARIDAWQSYLKDFLAQVQQLKKSGASPDEAAARMDLRSHAKDYPTIRAAGADRDVVARIYDILDGKIK